MLGGLSGVERSTAARANAAGSYGSRGVANGGDGLSSSDTDTPAVAGAGAGRSTAGEDERTGQSSASSEASSA